MINLRIDEIINEGNEFLTVGWTAPINLDQCDAVNYQVAYLEGENELGRVTAEQTYYNFMLLSPPCAEVTMEVTAKSGEVIGMAATQEYNISKLSNVIWRGFN